MEFAKNITRLSALALGIAGALAMGQAHAAGFQLKENSVKAQGRAIHGSWAANQKLRLTGNPTCAGSTGARCSLSLTAAARD